MIQIILNIINNFRLNYMQASSCTKIKEPFLKILPRRFSAFLDISALYSSLLTFSPFQANTAIHSYFPIDWSGLASTISH